MPSTLQVDIVTPDENVFQGVATRFRAPGVEGSFEVLPRHAPLLSAIEIGPLFVTTPEGDRITFATSGGFVEVLGDQVIVLAETAEPASKIDIERARDAEERALEQLEAGEEEMDRGEAEAALERARNRIRVAIAHANER